MNVSRDGVQKFVEEAERFKNTRGDNGDVGAVFLVAEIFEEDAVDLEGFYRISREAGFHIILVEKDPFTMIFP